MREGARYPNCFDPYLRYAISTDFKYFRFFDEEKNFRLFFLVEFKQDKGAADEFERKMNPRHQPPLVEIGPADHESRYATVRGRRAAVDPGKFDIWRDHVSRVELSLPLTPSAEFEVERRR